MPIPSNNEEISASLPTPPTPVVTTLTTPTTKLRPVASAFVPITNAMPPVVASVESPSLGPHILAIDEVKKPISERNVVNWGTTIITNPGFLKQRQEIIVKKL
jgi:hypothetical protein